ncbi:hypothetical protein [Williamsia sp.]|uniref:hypothetical protein n=1 Tax=Williamsia sp. TaxID=1872085 RepID=UPI002F9506CD
MSLNTRDQSLCLWLAPIFVVLLIAAMAIAGFLPPMSPNMSAEDVAAYYRDNVGPIRTGLLIINAASALVVPFFVVVAMQMSRMKLWNQALLYAFFMCVASNAGLFAVADVAWLAAALRPDRQPELIQLLNDIGWICFVAPVGVLVVQIGLLGAAILLDQSRRPVFPRWSGWFTIAMAVCIAPSALAVSTTDGPLAWDGAISFYLRFGSYILFLIVLWMLTRAALKRQVQDELDEMTELAGVEGEIQESGRSTV